jgi:hypothetical protein
MKNNRILQNCERCGAEIDMEQGEPCYQRGCDYHKAALTDDTEGYEENTKEDWEEDTTAVIDFFPGDSPITNSNNGDDSHGDGEGIGESILEEASSGCVWGFLEIIWKIVTFPFRVIWSIIAFFLDD